MKFSTFENEIKFENPKVTGGDRIGGRNTLGAEKIFKNTNKNERTNEPSSLFSSSDTIALLRLVDDDDNAAALLPWSDFARFAPALELALLVFVFVLVFVVEVVDVDVAGVETAFDRPVLFYNQRINIINAKQKQSSLTMKLTSMSMQIIS